MSNPGTTCGGSDTRLLKGALRVHSPGRDFCVRVISLHGQGVGGCQGVSTEFELKFFCADLSRMPAPIDPGTAHPPGLVTPVTQTTATTMSDDDMNVDEGASSLSGGLRGLSLFSQSQAGGL